MPKKCRFEKMPQIFSAHFWFSKTGKSPLFLATTMKIRPYTLINSKQKWAEARFHLVKVGNLHQLFSSYKRVRTFFSPPDSSRFSIHQDYPPLNFKSSYLTDIEQCMQKLVKSFVFLIDVLHRLVRRRVGVAFGVFSQIFFIQNQFSSRCAIF